MHDPFRRWTTFDRSGQVALVQRLLAEHGRRHWRSYALSFALAGVAAGCISIIAYLVGNLINQAYVHRSFTMIAGLCLVIVVIFTVKGVAAFGQIYVLGRVSNDIIADMQRRMFDKVLTESISHFADRHSSEILTRATFGIAGVGGVLNTVVNDLSRNVITVIGLVAVMVIQYPLLSLVLLLVLPAIVFTMRHSIRSLQRAGTDQYQGTADYQQVLLETLQGFRVVKTFTIEPTIRQRVRDSIAAIKQASNRGLVVGRGHGPVMESLAGIAIALVFLYGGYRVIEMGESPGPFVSFITAFLLCYAPIKQLATVNMSLHQSLVGVRMVYEFLDSKPTEPDDDDKPALRVGSGRVAFSEVKFSYRPGEPVLRGLSIVAEPGQMTALVGPSGGGKSTALSLIPRLHEVVDGTITIDGQDIAEVSRRSLRQSIAYVGQDPFLFSGSIRDNIALGRPDASDEAVVAAAKAAVAHDFIVGFPLGYDTPVGENGLKLSTGQRQRIAIARALIKDAPIVLLDEATAALDNESERAVRDAIAELCRDRTTIVVAHRLHTVVHAARIYVIEDGRVLESGIHAELFSRGARYATFYRLQLQEQERETDAKIIAFPAA